jgi:hypothetical protein
LAEAQFFVTIVDRCLYGIHGDGLVVERRDAIDAVVIHIDDDLPWKYAVSF